MNNFIALYISVSRNLKIIFLQPYACFHVKKSLKSLSCFQSTGAIKEMSLEAKCRILHFIRKIKLYYPLRNHFIVLFSWQNERYCRIMAQIFFYSQKIVIYFQNHLPMIFLILSVIKCKVIHTMGSIEGFLINSAYCLV